MSLRHRLRRGWITLYTRIVREKASPEYVARGWAIGMFYGCFIPFGVQLILSIPTAIFLKGSKIGATFGTLLTNPFTIGFIYPAQCWVGNKLLGGDLTYAATVSALKDVLSNQDWSSLLSLGGELVAAFFLGGALLTIVCVPITYFFVLRMVRAYRVRKAVRLAAKQNSVRR